MKFFNFLPWLIAGVMGKCQNFNEETINLLNEVLEGSEDVTLIHLRETSGSDFT